MSLATVDRKTNGAALATRRPAADIALSIDEVWMLAEQAAKSRLFAGIDTPDKAFTLMCLCQSEGLHPMQALRRFDIIQGRPAMKAAAIQAEMLNRGWVIELVESTATIARAMFSHPTRQPKPVELSAGIAEFKHLSGKDNWKNYPIDMNWARLMSRGCRRFEPGIIVGIGSVEERWDEFEREEAARRPQIAPEGKPLAELPPRGGDVEVPGAPPGIDGRALKDVVQGAADATGKSFAEALGWLRNKAVQSGRLTGDVPTKPSKIVESLTKLYQVERDWLRGQLAEWAKPAEAVEEEIPATEAPAPVTDAPTRESVKEMFPASQPGAYGREPGADDREGQ